MSSSSASYAIGVVRSDSSASTTTTTARAARSFDDGSFGGSEGAAPTPTTTGIDGAIAEEDEGEDASPAA